MNNKNKNAKFVASLPERCREIISKQYIKFPQHLCFEYGDAVKIILPSNAVSKNMQEDDGAFEGWVLAVYSLLRDCGTEKEILLDIEDGYEEKGKNAKGHYNRFLYRLMKFNEQFAFVKLTDRLSEHLGQYYYNDEYIKFSESKLVINKPNREADCSKETYKPEAEVEMFFNKNPKFIAEKTLEISGIRLIDGVYRQLPVGIFKDKVAKNTGVFTGGASAVDLWSVSKNGEDMCIYELKAKDNEKVGIVSELFFYANLMYDVYGPCKNITKSIKGSNAFRGYSALANLEIPIKKVHAYFLAEKMHPLVTAGVINLLTNANVEYEIIKYDYKSF